MAADAPLRPSDATMDAKSLYREEIYTDRKVGTLRVLVPVKNDGSPDTARPTVFQGEAQLMTNMGPLPISFDIEAKDPRAQAAQVLAREVGIGAAGAIPRREVKEAIRSEQQIAAARRSCIVRDLRRRVRP